MKKKKEHKHSQAGTKNTLKTASASKTDNWKSYAALLGILLLSFLAYLPVLQNGFVWDDDLYIQSNTLINTINLKEIFSQNVAGNYHPLTMLTLAIEYHFFGLNETGYHAVNLLLHLLNIALVFYAIFLLSDKMGVALAVSLLFGIHPLHVESVAWAAEVKDLLYTFFFLASYVFYLKYLKEEQKKFYVFALLLFLLSLLSKAMAASLPVVLLLTDYFKGRKISTKTLLEKVPFFLLAFILGVVAVSVQESAGATDMISLPFPQRIVFACYGFITYLIKLLLPLNLSAYYPYPIKEGESIPVQYYVYVLLFLCLAAYLFYSFRSSRKVIFSIGFFSITVFLVLQLLPVGGAVMADRYSYIPSIGIFYLAAEGLYFLWNKNLKWVAIGLLSAFTIFFSVKTYARCNVWKNELTLWSDVISGYPDVAMAYCNRGINLAKEEKYKEAISDFDNAIRLKPNYSKAYCNRGLAFKKEKNYEKAINDFNQAILLRPDFLNAFYNRGLVYKHEKKYAEALSDFNKAIELQPGFADAYNNRGIVFANLKQFENATNDYLQAVKLQETYAEAYANLGNIYSEQKRYAEAISNYNKAIEINSSFSEAYFNRGLSQYYSGNKDAACLDLKQSANLGYKVAKEAHAQICK